MSPVEVFVERLIEISFPMRDEFQKFVGDWIGEELPYTMLFGALGGRFANDFHNIDEGARTAIMSLIEFGNTSQDEYLGTVVATGFIEALVNTSIQIPGRWDEVAILLGPESRAYAEAWLKF